MRYFTLLIGLLLPAVSFCQSKRVDTTYYKPGVVESISWYTTCPRGELSRADLFQRGISPHTAFDSIELQDSIHYFDIQGNRAPTTPRLAERQRALQARRERFQAQIRDGKFSAFGLHAPVRLLGRVGEVLTGTLTVHHFGEDTLTVGLDGQGAVLLGMDSLSLLGRTSRKLPLVAIPRPGSQTARVVMLNTAGVVATQRDITIWGYDLNTEDFGDSRASAEVIDWLAGRDLYLRVTGNQKLLIVRHAGREDREIPLGKELEAVSTLQWSVGDYTLALKDLGTGEERYCQLRVF